MRVCPSMLLWREGSVDRLLMMCIIGYNHMLCLSGTAGRCNACYLLDCVA